MRNHLTLPGILATVLTLMVFGPEADAQAQAANALGRSAVTPHTADGRVDLSGTWDHGSGTPFQAKQLGSSICLVACDEIPETASAAGGGFRAPDRPSYKPEYVAKVRDLNARQVEEDPVLRCENPGLPRIGPPDKIVQSPGEVVFLYDDPNGNFFRIIATDGRGHRADAVRSYLGDSVGRWEGDTLVVEVVNFNDKAWLTDDGSFHTIGLRVVERLSRDGDMLHWQATAYDPAVLVEPWEIRPRTGKLTQVELLEAPPCEDRDLAIVFDPTTSHDNPR